MASSDNESRRHSDSPYGKVPITITRSRAGKTVKLVVAGELDSTSAAMLDRFIRREELAEPTLIRVDLQHTSFMDAAGVRSLVAAARRAGAGSWRLRVVNARGMVRKVCDITQLDAMIDHWQSSGDRHRAGERRRRDSMTRHAAAFPG
ncbi:MAG TPA: STAS domain-containing protein [Actinomycetota bacterium]|nr:STAS domain-containing protein [Actinomycetota bacterium]